jgi:hypothetical protein
MKTALRPPKAPMEADKMTITIHVEGTKPDDIVRGLLAAQAVFDEAGETAAALKRSSVRRLLEGPAAEPLQRPDSWSPHDRRGDLPLNEARDDEFAIDETR